MPTSSANARPVVGSAPRIAVVKLGALGDGLYTFPVVSALKAFRPRATITWVVEERLRDLPRLHPAVDEIVTIDTRGWRLAARRGRWATAWRGIAGYYRSVAGRFDVVLDVQGLLKSGVAAWLTGAPVRIGFAPEDCREPLSARLMTHHAAPAGRVHALTRNLGLLGALGAPIGPPRVDVVPAPADETWAAERLAAHGIERDDQLAAIHPGAGHPAKRWAFGRFLSLAERLGRVPGVRAVLVAGPEDRAAVEEAATRMASPPAVIAPPSLGNLAALLRRCRVVIAGDTGPLHLAAALGVRTVALYGPSDPVLAAPVGTGHRVIKYPCACGWTPGPFFNRRCVDPPCMAAIGIDEVCDVTEQALAAAAVA
ncbi:MAG: glycosyltransferase family 9 protein [Nitrospirae bacterium]|nr:glycosyltransferase family 9 protein [Nitrospirota bacterium]